MQHFASDTLQRAIYEAPLTVAMGPHWAACAAGFAVLIMGEYYITPAGERYLANRKDTTEC